MEKKDPIAEAKRYMENAKTILREKAKKNGKEYEDSKYTRMAGNCMWNGSLIALKAALGLKTKRGQRLGIDDFKDAAAKKDRKLLNNIVKGYNTMHLAMGYDGATGAGTVSDGMRYMSDIIDWCETRTAKSSKGLSGTKTVKKAKPQAKRTTKKT